MDDTEKLPKNGDKLLDSENMEYEENVDSRSNCSASGKIKAENGEIQSEKRNPVMLSEPVSQSEGFLANSNNRNVLESREYSQPDLYSYRERRSTVECFASGEDSGDSFIANSNDESQVFFNELTPQVSSRKQTNVRNLREPDISPLEQNNYGYMSSSPDFVEHLETGEDLQRILNLEDLSLNMHQQKKSSKLCKNDSEKVYKSRKKLDFSDTGSLYVGERLTGAISSSPGLSHSRDSIPQGNISPPKVDLPGPSTCESPDFKLFGCSNRIVRNTSPVSELPVPSNSKTRRMDRSLSFELPGPSKLNVHWMEEPPRLNLSGCSNSSGQSESSGLELPGTSNNKAHRMNAPPFPEIPRSSKHYVQRTHKSLRTLNLNDSDSSNDDVQLKKSSKRKKRRKSRKNISFHSSYRKLCKNNSVLCTVIDKEGSSFSDSSKALRKYCVEDTLSHIENDTLEAEDELDVLEVSNLNTSETSRTSRKRLGSHSENTETEKIDAGHKIYKKFRRSRSSER